MSIYQKLKGRAASMLERHPLGYAIGGFLLERCDFLLPHEADYFGFPVLAACGVLGDGVALDLGANRGHSARAFLRLVPDLKVHSIEANPLHAACLARIQHRWKPRFSYAINAVSDFSGNQLTLYTPAYGAVRLHSATSIFEEEAAWAFEEAFPRLKGQYRIEVHRVQSLAVDDLGLDVAFAKVDVQGAETAALRGMRETIERSRPILLVEKSSSYKAVGRLLSGVGYEPWRFDPMIGKFRPGVGVFESSHHSNVFFVPREKTDRVPS